MAPSLVVLALLGLFAGAEACIQMYGTVAEGHVSFCSVIARRRSVPSSARLLPPYSPCIGLFVRSIMLMNIFVAISTGEVWSPLHLCVSGCPQLSLACALAASSHQQHSSSQLLSVVMHNQYMQPNIVLKAVFCSPTSRQRSASVTEVMVTRSTIW